MPEPDPAPRALEATRAGGLRESDQVPAEMEKMMTRKRNSILDGTAVVLAAGLGTAVATAHHWAWR